MKQKLLSHSSLLVLLLAFFPAMANDITSYASSPDDHDTFLKLAIFPAIILGPIFLLATRYDAGVKREPKSPEFFCFHGLFFILVSIFLIPSGVEFLNSRLDRSPVAKFDAAINNKYESGDGRRRKMILDVRFSPTSGLGTTALRVKGPTFERFEVGDCISVSTHTGAFGVRWVKKIEQKACH